MKDRKYTFSGAPVPVANKKAFEQVTKDNSYGKILFDLGLTENSEDWMKDYEGQERDKQINYCLKQCFNKSILDSSITVHKDIKTNEIFDKDLNLVYVDNYKLLALVAQIFDYCMDNFDFADLIIGIEPYGLPLASTLAIRMDVGFISYYDKIDEYLIKEGQRVIIIDSVLKDGKEFLDVRNEIKKHKGIVVGCLTITDIGNNVDGVHVLLK
jgi:adenine/guanine phosphoribosyltransferase-like PRPP-binding protein